MRAKALSPSSVRWPPALRVSLYLFYSYSILLLGLRFDFCDEIIDCLVGTALRRRLGPVSFQSKVVHQGSLGAKKTLADRRIFPSDETVHLKRRGMLLNL